MLTHLRGGWPVLTFSENTVESAVGEGCHGIALLATTLLLRGEKWEAGSGASVMRDCQDEGMRIIR